MRLSTLETFVINVITDSFSATTTAERLINYPFKSRFSRAFEKASEFCRAQSNNFSNWFFSVVFSTVPPCEKVLIHVYVCSFDDDDDVVVFFYPLEAAVSLPLWTIARFV